MMPELMEEQQAQDPISDEPTGLSEAAQTALVDLVTKTLKAEQWARRQEVMRAREQRYYERGDQNLFYNRSSYQFVPLADSGATLPPYTDVYNIYRPNLRTLVSVMSQNTPGVNFVPNSLKSAADILSASLAEKTRHKLYREVDTRALQTEVARLFCTDSRVIVRTSMADGKVVQTAHGVLESKVPIYLRGGIARWPYLVLSDEMDRDAAREEYENEEIEGVEDTTSSAYERYARLGVLSGTRSQGAGEVAKDLVTRHIVWLRPSRYRKLTEDARKEIKAVFSDGVRVTVCGGTFCEATVADWDNLAVAFPAPGDGQNRPSLLRDLVPLQDAFNDGMNQVREFFDYGIPATWFNEDSIDAEAISVQRSEPAAMHPAAAPAGRALSDAFWQEAPAVLPPGLMEYLQTIQGSLSQFITGNFPSLYGAEAPSLETMGAYSMSHDSAMGNLAPAWGAMQRLFASIALSGVKMLATIAGDEELSVEGQNGTTDSFRASDVLVGEIGCEPDRDSSFPETTASKRAAYNQYVQQLAAMDGGPEILGQPDNLKLGLQLSGLEDFVIPGAEARDKQLREIEILLASEPQGASVDQQEQSSVPVDADFDYHQAEFDKVQQWLSSQERDREERDGNVRGIQNVRMHGLQHKAVLDKRAADAASAQAQANQSPPVAPKQPSVSIAYKDVTDPDAKAQMLREAGIHVASADLEEQQGMNAAQEALPHVLAHQKAAKQAAIDMSGAA